MEIKPNIISQPNNFTQKGQIFNVGRKKITGGKEKEQCKLNKCSCCNKLFTKIGSEAKPKYTLTDFETTYRGIMKSIFTR